MKVNTYHQQIETFLNKNKGYINTSDVLDLGISKPTFKKYIKQEGLIKVIQGVYRRQDAWVDDLYEIQLRFPQSVFSHETASFLNNLSDRAFEQVSVTVKSSTNATALKNLGVKVYMVNGQAMNLGLETIQTTFGHTVNIYNAERTVCDLIRSRNLIEIEVVNQSIKNYMSQNNKNIPQLMDYAKAFSVDKILTQLIQLWL